MTVTSPRSASSRSASNSRSRSRSTSKSSRSRSQSPCPSRQWKFHHVHEKEPESPSSISRLPVIPPSSPFPTTNSTQQSSILTPIRPRSLLIPLLSSPITNTSRTFLFICPASDPESYSFASNVDIRYAIWTTETDPVNNAPVDIGYVECNASVRPTALRLPCSQARFFKKPVDMKPVEVVDRFINDPASIAGPWTHGDFINYNIKKRPSKEEQELYEIMEHLEAGRDVRWLSEQGYAARSTRVIMWIKEYTRCIPPQAVSKSRTRLTVLQGEGGTGKTTILDTHLPNETVFRKSNSSNQFWDGYNAAMHPAIILEEVSANSLSLSSLKEIASTGATNVDLKGARSTPMLAERLYMVSNSCFQKIYKIESEEQLLPLRRRVDVFFKMTKGAEFLVGYSLIRMRFQFPSDPLAPMVSFLGLWYPKTVDFERQWEDGARLYVAKGGRREDLLVMKEDLRLWTLLTEGIVASVIGASSLTPLAQTLMAGCTESLKFLMDSYEWAENTRWRESVVETTVEDKSRLIYSDTYDLVPYRMDPPRPQIPQSSERGPDLMETLQRQGVLSEDLRAALLNPDHRPLS